MKGKIWASQQPPAKPAIPTRYRSTPVKLCDSLAMDPDEKRDHQTDLDKRGGFVRQLVRYGIAVATVTVALLARLALDPLLKDQFPFSTFYIAVAVTSYFAGLGPALVSLLLGLVISVWFVIPPRTTLEIRGLPDIVEILIYLLVTGTITTLIPELLT
jgi:K+-sensing histidine kinase KdpD